MSVTDLFQRVTIGDAAQKHYECRICGDNLNGADSECPSCGGSVAVYEL